LDETTYNNRMSFITGLFESNMCSMYDDYIKLDKFNTESFKKDISILLYSCGIEHKFDDKKMIIIDDLIDLGYMNNQKFYTKTFPTIINNQKTYKLNSMNIGIADIQEIKLYGF
jgi:hypothetical protein